MPNIIPKPNREKEIDILIQYKIEQVLNKKIQKLEKEVKELQIRIEVLEAKKDVRL